MAAGPPRRPTAWCGCVAADRRLPVHQCPAFPVEEWGRLLARRWRRSSRSLMAYQDSAGYKPLREAIATYLCAARGVRCDADQVIVVGGSQQALDPAMRVLVDPWDTAWIEHPGYLGARGAMLGAGVNPAAAQLASEHGVTVQPLSIYGIEPLRRGGLLLGYAGLSEDEIQDGVRRLANALRKMAPYRPPAYAASSTTPATLRASSGSPATSTSTAASKRPPTRSTGA